VTLARLVRPWYVSSKTGKRLPIRPAPKVLGGGVLRRPGRTALWRLSGAVLARLNGSALAKARAARSAG
jgi:hypothetical protein